MADVMRDHIEIVHGASGPKPRIAGHRIQVQDVAIWCEKLGMSADAIILRHPRLTLADVHAALALYWDNRDEFEAAIAQEQAFIEAFRQATPARCRRS